MSITPIYGWHDSQAESAVEPAALLGVGFWPRAAARLIDALINYLVAFFSATLFMFMLRVASGGHIPPLILAKLRHGSVTRFIFALLATIAYQVILTAMHGSTFGKLTLSMVVVQEDGSPCRLKSALIRELGYFVDALFFGIIGYVAMNRTPQEQRYGDEWAHTIVCKRPAIAPDKLRDAERFAVALLFALIVDAALIMTGMLTRIVG